MALCALALTACGTDDNSGTVNDPEGPGGLVGRDSTAIECATGTLTGAGSTAQANAVDEWTKAYQAACDGATINYQPTCSGAGGTSFAQDQITFAGSDSALTADQQPKADARCGSGNRAINIPMLLGPIAIAYRLDGVTDIQFKPATIAKIFTGEITKWDDPAIKADNPKAQLPSVPIQAFHRSDSSGTTDNFTKFLTATASAAWPHEPGKSWPPAVKGGQGTNGSSGMADAVRAGGGTIGYMEQSFAENAGLSLASVANGAGEFVALTRESAAKAIASAKITGTGNDLALAIDYATSAAGAYPIVMVTYEIVCERGTPAESLDLLKSYLTYTSSEDGQGKLGDSGYAPLPQNLLTKVQASVKALV
jgi:phosphate transport system substrate-binding protein